MIKDSSKKDFDAVIVHKLDRFSRDRYDSAFYKRELKRNGIKLFSVSENLDDSPESISLKVFLKEWLNITVRTLHVRFKKDKRKRLPV